ncbi:hypothetical protein [Dyadobacter psychrophilus]|uniref:Uncharacterized protein n=1 Tax=Dyadobacter psychrophilus TaxID=651661 RepID=A0A1T5CQ81_9BACT|nr:hypothetical protein [Dyadobacter psychrophilus]SKB61340.1 hypothetical protein SAMN05660293_01425 [Dyadobacter psychrophilus]
MDNNQIVTALFDAVQNNNLDIAGADKKFYTKLVLHAAEIRDLYTQLYNDHPEFGTNFTKLIEVLISAHLNRPQELKDRDNKKPENWYISNELAGMSIHMDRFSGGLNALRDKFPYFQDLGINVLHLINAGTNLNEIRAAMHQNGMSLMLDLSQNNQAISDCTNPAGLVKLLEEIFTQANVGVDILRIDVADFKENQFHIHTIFQLVKQCLQVTSPGMALAVSAIGSAEEAMTFFGEGRYMAKEADFVYNTTQTALQRDALASGQVTEMAEAEVLMLNKPFGTTWITSASNVGNTGNSSASLQQILLMQANCFLIGGLPMLSYQDELEGTIESKIFSGIKKLLTIRKRLNVVADTKNTRWLPRHNIHIAGFVRNGREKALYCIFNYSNESAYLTWHSFRHNGLAPEKLYDHWREDYYEPGSDAEFLVIEPYGFYLLEVVA